MTTIKANAIDIRALTAAYCGIEITELSMMTPVTGVLTFYGDKPTITLNAQLSETQKRMAIASLLAVCLVEDKQVNAIVTEAIEDTVAKRARGLLMPEAAFTSEYKRLENFGKLRCSVLATTFNVPLSDVLMRMKDLGLEV